MSNQDLDNQNLDNINDINREDEMDKASLQLLLNVIKEAAEESKSEDISKDNSINTDKDTKKIKVEEKIGIAVNPNLKSLSMLPYLERARKEHFRPLKQYAQKISPSFFYIREEYINSFIHELKNYALKEAVVKLFCRDVFIIEINQYNKESEFNECQSTFSISLLKNIINIEYLNIDNSFNKDNCVFDLSHKDDRNSFLFFIKNLDRSGLKNANYTSDYSEFNCIVLLNF